MKIFLSVLVLIYSFQSWTKADNIGDFEIGNFSLNKSLLNYYSKKNLIKNWNGQKIGYGFKSNKYYKFAFFGSEFDPYDHVVLYTLRGDNNFIIKSITGFRSDFEIKKCYKEMNTIAKEINEMFPNSKQENYGPSIKPLDPSGKSTEKGILFILVDGSVVGISCIDYSNEYLKKYDWESDHMQIFLDTKEYDKWLRDEAWQ